MIKRGAEAVHRSWPAFARVAIPGVLALGVLAAGPGLASAGEVEYISGVDASHHNGSPDWAAARADGVRFAFVKATEGQAFVDNRYHDNRAQADAAGVAFGAYHFARPDSTAADAILEADHFVNTANIAGRHLLPVLDLEVDGGLGPRALRRWTRTWLERVHQRLGVRPIIYTTPSFWIERLGDSRSFADAGYPLWIAHWYVDQPRVPAQNWGGRGWTFWQHSDCGSVDGFNGCVDLDRYAGARLAAVRISNNR